MGTKRHKLKEILTKLRRVEVDVAQGWQCLDATPEVRITEPSFYRWRKQYGGAGSAQPRELKRPRDENERSFGSGFGFGFGFGFGRSHPVGGRKGKLLCPLAAGPPWIMHSQFSVPERKGLSSLR